VAIFAVGRHRHLRLPRRFAPRKDGLESDGKARDDVSVGGFRRRRRGDGVLGARLDGTLGDFFAAARERL
jgi:hypothetical protein